MLLAYYIATINIEHAYHNRIGGEYRSFPGAVLTDTFQMYEANDPLDVEMFVENSELLIVGRFFLPLNEDIGVKIFDKNILDKWHQGR